MSEESAKQGARGAEQLAFCVSRYTEGLIKIIMKYGGDIIKFVGDAMIIVWPPGKPGTGGMKELARKATQCALEIQTEFHSKQIMQGFQKLSVKVVLFSLRSA